MNLTTIQISAIISAEWLADFTVVTHLVWEGQTQGTPTQRARFLIVGYVASVLFEPTENHAVQAVASPRLELLSPYA